MNIDKALEHFKWKLVETDEKGKAIKLKTNFKPTKRDLEAYNSILDYKDKVESKSLVDNECFAKLWIHQLILFCRTGAYNGERSIQVLDEILSKSTYEWCVTLKKEIPMMRFGSIGNDKYHLEPKDYYNNTKLDERNKKIAEEYETELTEAIKYEPKESDIIRFIEKQITRAINKFEK